MPAILFDYDVQGHFRVLSSIWTSPERIELWKMLDCEANTFRGLAIPRETTDGDLWDYCQSNGFVLVTGNRNSKGDQSLEAVLQQRSQASSLPVLTIADADRVMTDRSYAERVADQIMELIFDLEKFRGTRRLFVP